VEKLPHGVGAPFGALLILNLLILGIVQGIRILSKRNRSTFTWLTCFIPLFFVAFVFVGLAARGESEWNVKITAQDLVGTWQFRGSTIKLNSDSTYDATISKEVERTLKVGSGTGKWNAEMVQNGFNFYLVAQDGKVSEDLRPIEWRKELRFIIDDFRDPDGWHGNYGFKRTKPE
jgi:hypothetical protein